MVVDNQGSSGNNSNLLVVREISRMEPYPENIESVYEMLTDLCFSSRVCTISENISESKFDALLVFGVSNKTNQHLCADAVNKICTINKPKYVYVTGGVTKLGDIPQAKVINSLIHTNLFLDTEFILEEKAMDTRGNVVGAVQTGLGRHKRIAFVAKAGHCGRAILTIRKYLPDVLIVTSYEYNYPVNVEKSPSSSDLMFGRTTWMFHDEWRSRVWSEFLRIEKYGMRGDIDYPNDVQTLVSEIRKITSGN